MSKLIYVENKALVISDKLFEFMDQDEKRNAAEKENMIMEFIENFIMAISGDFLMTDCQPKCNTINKKTF